MLMDRKNYRNVMNPFDMLDEMEHAFLKSGGNVPFRTDIREVGDHYLLEADLPGFEKSDIHIELENGILNIRAERHSQIEDTSEDGTVLRSERSFGSFRRSFDLTGVDAEAITASYQNGVLSLTLPKEKKELPLVRSIDID